MEPVAGVGDITCSSRFRAFSEEKYSQFEFHFSQLFFNPSSVISWPRRNLKI